MSKFQLRIAGAPDTEIVCAKIGALCAFHNDQSKLDPAFFKQVLSDPETQLLVKLAEDRGQVIGLMAYFPMSRLYSATSGLHCINCLLMNATVDRAAHDNFWSI